MFSINTTTTTTTYEPPSTNTSTNTSSNSSTASTSLFYGYPVVVPLALAMVAIIVCAVGGNVMVVLTILRHRGMRTRTNMFIVNLAVADILVAVLDMPVSLITIVEGDWVFGEALCKLNGFTMALFLICSIHTLMYISVHKYISITRPFSRVMTQRRIKLIILASWLWATFCATGPLVGWNTTVYKKGASQCGPAMPRGLSAVSHSILITTSNYVIPLAVMCFCYSRIFREIHVHMRRIRETSNIDLENSVTQQKKVATTLFLVLSCFLLCWTPFIIYSNAAVILKDKASRMPPILNPLAYWCGYFNSACNPIIYAFRSPSFRRGYKEIMCGAPSAKLSAVNSMSFRSRSARGSAGSNANNTIKVKSEDDGNKAPAIRRQRTLLSQTSWRSMTFVPNLMRSLSTSRSPDSSRQTSREESRETDCFLCGCWSPGGGGEEHRDFEEYDQVDQVVRPEEIREEDEEQIREEEDEERIREGEEKIRKDEEIVAEDSDAENGV